MPSLADQHCFNHASREAVARCPECGRTFCRECITEHEDRVVCASCLRQLAGSSRPARHSWRWLVSLTQSLLALFLLWFCFYGVGRALIAIPTSFHEGTLWRQVAGADP